MDAKIVKEKRARDRKLAGIRKRFKKINQAGQEKENKPKKRNFKKIQNENDSKVF